jgi:hypothetical protein
MPWIWIYVGINCIFICKAWNKIVIISPPGAYPQQSLLLINKNCTKRTYVSHTIIFFYNLGRILNKSLKCLFIYNKIYTLPKLVQEGMQKWAVSRQNHYNGFSASMDPDQPAPPRRLIRVHAVGGPTL